MKQSQLFSKTLKQVSKDETSLNAQLLLRGGFVHKEMAGVYSYLPLGLRVLNKIENIIREEMNMVHGQEIRMATLHPSDPWKKTKGWENIDVLFKIQSRTEKEYALGQSEEEIITPIAQSFINSYKDMPIAIYQIGQKYRDELRAKSGIMRGREFGMKDMYSFHTSQDDFERFYNIVKEAYIRVFNRAGLDAKVTEASGGSFTEKLSYEFMVITDAGEDDIVYCNDCNHCANIEVSKERDGDTCPKCGKGKLMPARAAEVGNVFDLGQKYVRDFGFTYKDADGKENYPIMGCYGIGTTRLMGTIVEKCSDTSGIIWPESVAPFRVHLLSFGEEVEVKELSEDLYKKLNELGIDVLYDDRDETLGVKLKDSDLIGIPNRVVISPRSLKAGGLEVSKRGTEGSNIMSVGDFINSLAKNV